VNDSSSARLYHVHGLRILSEIPLGQSAQDGPHNLAVSWSRDGVPSEAWPWVQLLGACAVLSVVVGVLAFGPLLEEA